MRSFLAPLLGLVFLTTAANAAQVEWSVEWTRDEWLKARMTVGTPGMRFDFFFSENLAFTKNMGFSPKIKSSPECASNGVRSSLGRSSGGRIDDGREQ